jgi:hypothetical protein
VQKLLPLALEVRNTLGKTCKDVDDIDRQGRPRSKALADIGLRTSARQHVDAFHHSRLAFAHTHTAVLVTMALISGGLELFQSNMGPSTKSSVNVQFTLRGRAAHMALAAGRTNSSLSKDG